METQPPKSPLRILKESLRPKGSANLVRIGFNATNGAAYYSEEFVQQCIERLETKLAIAHVGMDSLNELEMLAAHLLFSSAYMEPKRL